MATTTLPIPSAIYSMMQEGGWQGCSLHSDCIPISTDSATSSTAISTRTLIPPTTRPFSTTSLKTPMAATVSSLTLAAPVTATTYVLISSSQPSSPPPTVTSTTNSGKPTSSSDGINPGEFPHGGVQPADSLSPTSTVTSTKSQSHTTTFL